MKQRDKFEGNLPGKALKYEMFRPQMLIPLLLLFLLISAGCKKEEQAIPATPEIFPLKVGYKWNFLAVRNDSVRSNHVNEVTKDTIYDGQPWFILTYDTAIHTICKNQTGGWWFLYSAAAGAPGVPALYYKYPAQVNDQYFTIDSSLVKVVSINEKVTVAAGTFTCYHYHMIHYRESYECEEYFAPGTGFIKHVIYVTGSGTSSVFETTTLVSCNIPSQ